MNRGAGRHGHACGHATRLPGDGSGLPAGKHQDSDQLRTDRQGLGVETPRSILAHGSANFVRQVQMVEIGTPVRFAGVKGILPLRWVF
jgi:hypothetical protein